MGVSSSEPSQHSAPCSDLSFSPLPLPLPRPHPLSCSPLTVWLTDTPTLDSLEPTLPPTELLLPTPDTVLLPLLPLLPPLLPPLLLLLPLLLPSPPLTVESPSPTVLAFLRLPPTLSLPSGLWLRLPSLSTLLSPSSSGETRSLTKRSLL